METCKRCLGKGQYTVALSEPGTERVPYAEVVWQDREGPFKCLACKGSGERWVKPTEPSRHFQNPDITEIA